MKVEEIQHGGDHYKDQPKHLQPIWLGTALNLNPMEYSVLKYLLRHRKKGGLEDLKKMVHFAQMLMEHEYGVCPVVVYPEQDSPSDVSGEEIKDMAEPKPDPCPFQVDDIIQARKLFENHHCPKWHIYRIEDDKVLVSCVEDQQPGDIRRGEWCNYSVVGKKPPYRLAVVGELYKSAKTGDIYRVTKVDAADWVYLESTTTKMPHAVQWRLDSSNYKLEESPSTVRYPVVGEIYKGRKSGNMYRVCQTKEEHIRLQDSKSGYSHTVNWNSSLSSDYERVTDETE